MLDHMVSDGVLRGYFPGAIGRIVELHANYYYLNWGFGLLFEARVAKEITVDVEGPTSEIKDPWGNLRRGATATTKINRKDFGLTWNRILETGGVVVGEDVDIFIEIEMIKK